MLAPPRHAPVGTDPLQITPVTDQITPVADQITPVAVSAPAKFNRPGKFGSMSTMGDAAAEFLLLSKDGCTYCDRAKSMLAKHRLPFTTHTLANLSDLKARLESLGHGADHAATFPQVLHGGAYVGGFHQLEDYLTEPLLSPDTGIRRFTPFPIKYPDMWGMYKKALASFWTVEEVSLAQDVAQWKTLTDDERHFIEHVLAFFAASDGIVMENLALNFGVEVKAPEARCFYAYQGFNESIHSETYAVLIDALIESPQKREQLFGAIETMPAVRNKAAWALKWMNSSRRFAERLVAFACVEGILFSGSFCSIFWLKQRGLMPGLGLSNQFISRDEGLHQDFAVVLYRHLRNKLPADTVTAIVREAVENEKEFITEAIPCRLVGMNADLMARYIEFVADRLLGAFDVQPIYNASNPFPWMELISLAAKDNFFEKFSSEYQKAGVMAKAEDQVFSLDGDF